MESFEGRLAVVTGGGTGMGRELVVQLAAQGCSVAMCDLGLDRMADTVDRATKEAPTGVRVTSHVANVADEAQVLAFRDEVLAQHGTDHVNLVFANAGVSGGGSFVLADREEWDRTFAICWGGVYNTARAFVPLLIKSDSGYLVNTSSVNGFWASLGPGVAHTAYSSAKFAVKGFSEALLEDFKLNAPHVKVAVVMPGHIGTDIVANTLASSAPELSATEEGRQMVEAFGAAFRDNAPTSAAEAATIILDGVKAGKWRILVGDDAHRLDERVRQDPEGIYDDGFRLFDIPVADA
ncbi:MAG: SDR family NAD(P)-dependent oxidoreductase [Actinomycetota bacterium]|nr:SDR family NAD(P)-dependent oxidoreductase [Actinomycetota bacterium]